jgi:hypothetical protein
MDMCVDVMERGMGSDYVVAHDTTWLGRDMAEALFARHGLKVSDHVGEKFAAPPAPSAHFQPSNASLARAIGRKPQRSILDVCEDMLKGA